MDRHRELYRGTIATGFAWGAAIWSVVAQIAPSTIDLPAPYLPLLNPLDFAQAAALLALSLHLRESAQPRAKLAILGTLGFLWLNGIALRTIHFWADVPYDLDDLLASPLVQAVLVLMTYASRSRVRPAWIAGAYLLGVVIVKLFVNDIAQAGNVTRIVTFLGVGALLLAIGYFAPVPPAAEAERRS